MPHTFVRDDVTRKNLGAKADRAAHFAMIDTWPLVRQVNEVLWLEPERNAWQDPCHLVWHGESGFAAHN